MALSENSLGKSPSNVFAKTSRREAIGGRGYTEVDINLIRPPEANPRQHFDPDALAELAESIRMQAVAAHRGSTTRGGLPNPGR